MVSSYSHDHSHWASNGPLGEWLADNNIPGIFGVDTRAITKQIRETGAVLGKIMYNNEVSQKSQKRRTNTKTVHSAHSPLDARHSPLDTRHSIQLTCRSPPPPR